MAYDYIQENYDEVSTDGRNLLIIDVPSGSIDLGIKAAQIARKDLGVRESSPGSKTGPRIDQYLETVGCRPGFGDWSTGAIATWYKEAGLPIPVKDVAAATGWLNWAIQTNRTIASPIIGSIAIYGTQGYDTVKETDTFTATKLGLVIQIDERANIIITCENIRGEIAQAESDIDSVLGFIIPSATDIKKPKITLRETLDESKADNLNEATAYTAKKNTKTPATKLSQIIREVVLKVLNVETKEECANGTYNQARQFVSGLIGKAIVPGRPFNAGGNAKDTGYHAQLEKLKYTREDFGTISHKQLRTYLNNSDNWNIGDVAVYWTETPFFSDCNAYVYGHTQIFTGGNQGFNGQFKWSTDNKKNWNTAFVYSTKDRTTKKDFSLASWRFIKFNAPDL